MPLLCCFLLLSACGGNGGTSIVSETRQAGTANETERPVVYAGEAASAAPIVYFTSDISPEGLAAVYEALGWEPAGNVAVKLSTGESERSNNLDPALIQDLVQLVDGTIVECNTAYTHDDYRTERRSRRGRNGFFGNRNFDQLLLCGYGKISLRTTRSEVPAGVFFILPNSSRSHR